MNHPFHQDFRAFHDAQDFENIDHDVVNAVSDFGKILQVVDVKIGEPDDSVSDFVANFTVENKAEFVSALVERRSVFTKIEISKQNIVMMGNNAIVRNHLSGDTNTGGKPAHVELDVIYVFRLEGGDWKLIGRQAYKL